MYKRNGNRGQTVPLIGLLFFLLTGFGALAIDMGYVNYQQMRMQTAADNAALAGGQALIAGGCPNQAAANTAAQNNAIDQRLRGERPGERYRGQPAEDDRRTI